MNLGLLVYIVRQYKSFKWMLCCIFFCILNVSNVTNGFAHTFIWLPFWRLMCLIMKGPSVLPEFQSISPLFQTWHSVLLKKKKTLSPLSPCSNWELTSERWRSSACESVLKTQTLWKRLWNQSETGHQQLHRTSYFCTLFLSQCHHQHLALSHPAVCPAVAMLIARLVRSQCLVTKYSSTFQKSPLIRMRLSPGTSWKR